MQHVATFKTSKIWPGVEIYLRIWNYSNVLFTFMHSVVTLLFVLLQLRFYLRGNLCHIFGRGCIAYSTNKEILSFRIYI